MKSRGFTLIELLVVISIIAVIAALLFPVFAQVREKGRQTSCLSGVRQLAVGVLMYAQDYEDTLPPTAYETSAPDPTLWPTLIAPYTKSTQILHCPSDTNPEENSYGFNELAFADLTDNDNTVKTLAAFQTPSETVMLGDIGTKDDLVTPIYNAYKMTAPDGDLNDFTDARPVARHIGRVNIGLMDAHAKSFRIEQFYSNQTPPNKWFTP